MNKYCNNTWKDVVEDLETDIYKGLSEEDSQKRKIEYGDNQIKLPYLNNNIKIFIKSLLKVYLLIEMLICIFLIIQREYAMAFIAIIIFISNIYIKLMFTYRAQKEMNPLQNINSSNTTVLRNGRKTLVMSEKLVKGDIVFFKKGSLIAADIRIIEANNIKVDEKNITGENFLKDKFESKISGVISNIGEMKNILFKGSLIKEGDGFGVVIETGDSTQLGRLLAMLVYANKSKHTLGVRIEKILGRIIAILSAVAISMYFIFYVHEEALNNMNLVLFLISVGPVGIIIFASSLLLKKELLKDGIELINFSTLDSINEIDVIFLDKIGSITEEKMIVQKIYANDKIYNALDIDYENDATIQRLIQISLLSNNATYNVLKDSGSGDLVEIAYLSLAAKKKAYKSLIDQKYNRIFDIPMDSDERLYTTVNKHKSGYRANVQGNVDAVVDKCTSIMIDGVERDITEDDTEIIKAMDYNFSIEGLTPQGIAYRNFSYQPSSSEKIASNLVFVGIVALENPFIENVQSQVEEIKRRGIVPILFTEDNKIAAATIGEKAKFITGNDGVVSGIELDKLSKDEIIEVLDRVRVFSRVNPEIKGKIIGLYTNDNYVVAASGETLGDLPSLSLAKVGIGKGKAQNIVKKISDVFIKENYLNKFLELFDISKDFKAGIRLEIKTLITIIISEICIINLFSTINKGMRLDYQPMLVINLLLVIPLSLLMLREKGKKQQTKKYVVRTFLWTILTLIGTYNISSGFNEMTLIIFGGMVLDYAVFNAKNYFEKVSMILLGFAIGIWFIFIGILVLINPITLSISELIRVVIILAIYTAIELLIKKWQ